jgi:hypothetical protein
MKISYRHLYLQNGAKLAGYEDRCKVFGLKEISKPPRKWGLRWITQA